MPLAESVLNVKNQEAEFDSLCSVNYAVDNTQDGFPLESLDESHVVVVAPVQSLQSKYVKSGFFSLHITRLLSHFRGEFIHPSFNLCDWAHDKNISCFENLGRGPKEGINNSSVP